VCRILYKFRIPCLHTESDLYRVVVGPQTQGFLMLGRSDGVLVRWMHTCRDPGHGSTLSIFAQNPSGVRFGSAELVFADICHVGEPDLATCLVKTFQVIRNCRLFQRDHQLACSWTKDGEGRRESVSSNTSLFTTHIMRVTGSSSSKQIEMHHSARARSEI